MDCNIRNCSHVHKCEKTRSGLWRKVERYYVVWAFLIFVPLIIWCGYRGNVGDTSMYISSFYDMPSDFGGIETYMQGVKKIRHFSVFQR